MEALSDAYRVLRGERRWALVQGDNFTVLRALPTASVHLVYGDAPYCTGDVFTMPDGRVAYEDRWPSLDAFLANLRERCAAARDLLTGDGTFVLQVDPETSHYVKVMLDGVFGRECFANEIVWRYRKWPVKMPHFQRCHDVLFRYVRSAAVPPRWTQLYEPLAPSTLATWGDAKQNAVVEAGRRVASEATEEKSPGAPMSDVWELPIVAPSGNERTGYPTQKPEALIARVVDACSYEGDVVLDPWCGSGTTVDVAVKRWRRGIAIDQSPVAIEVATKRLTGTTKQGDLFAGST